MHGTEKPAGRLHRLPAGHATPQGLRNVLVISATRYQWKHIIGQRVYRRNTDETRIVLLKIWQELSKGSRVGQLMITPVVIADFVSELGEQRGTGGFGST